MEIEGWLTTYFKLLINLYIPVVKDAYISTLFMIRYQMKSVRPCLSAIILSKELKSWTTKLWVKPLNLRYRITSDKLTKI